VKEKGRRKREDRKEEKETRRGREGGRQSECSAVLCCAVGGVPYLVLVHEVCEGVKEHAEGAEQR
jgi:hypothetical protein